MADKIFGNISTLADIKEEDEENAIEENKKKLREIALSAKEFVETKQLRTSSTIAQPEKIIKAEESAQNENVMDPVAEKMDELKIEEDLEQQSITAGCYKEKNKPPPIPELRSLNQPTDGSHIKYNLEQLKAIGASTVVQANPEQPESEN